MQYESTGDALVLPQSQAPTTNEASSESLGRRLLRLLPVGLPLSEEVWERRHRVMVALVWLHAIVMPIAGLFPGDNAAIHGGPIAALAGWIGIGAGFGYGIAEGALIAFFGLIATLPQGGRRLRAAAVAMGLLTGSAAMVHLSGGFIEFHFHYFVVVALVALYQDWTPFLVAVVYVALQHGVFGAFNPAAVYNHPDGVEHPWKWAAVHAAFVLAEAAAILTGWRLAEEEAVRRRTAQARAAQLSVNLGELEASHRTNTTFLAGVSDGLRKPMNEILGQGRILLAGVDGTLSNQQESDVLRITESAEQMLGMIENVLDYSRLESGWQGNPPETVDLHPIIAGVRDSFVLAAHERHNELITNVPDRLPAVWADPEQVKRILTILLDNAVNYTANGRIAISARDTGKGIQVAVSDTGVGIPPEATELIFEAFRRSDVGTSRRNVGTGLGLAVAKRMIDLQGGSISVVSRLGAGSTFIVTLPEAAPIPVVVPASELRYEPELVGAGAVPEAPRPRAETRVIEYPRAG